MFLLLGPCGLGMDCPSHSWLMVYRLLERVKHPPRSLPFICQWINQKPKSPSCRPALRLLLHFWGTIICPNYPKARHQVASAPRSPLKFFKGVSPNLVCLLQLHCPSLPLKTMTKVFLQFPCSLALPANDFSVLWGEPAWPSWCVLLLLLGAVSDKLSFQWQCLLTC